MYVFRNIYDIVSRPNIARVLFIQAGWSLNTCKSDNNEQTTSPIYYI